MNDPIPHCMETLRDHDLARYLATLYLPQENRPALFALFAFSAEIAAISAKVTEPIAGEMRLQWWRDALRAGAGDRTGNPVAEAVLATINTHRLPREPLLANIDARAFDLYNDPMPDVVALEGYLGATNSVLYRLAALITGIDDRRELDDVCGHAGVAIGISRLVCELPQHRSAGKQFIPMDMVRAAGGPASGLLAGGNADLDGRLVRELCALGIDHVGRAITALGTLKAGASELFLPLGVQCAQLRRQAKAGARCFDEPVRLGALEIHARLLKTALSGI